MISSITNFVQKFLQPSIGHAIKPRQNQFPPNWRPPKQDPRGTYHHERAITKNGENSAPRKPNHPPPITATPTTPPQHPNRKQNWPAPGQWPTHAQHNVISTGRKKPPLTVCAQALRMAIPKSLRILVAN